MTPGLTFSDLVEQALPTFRVAAPDQMAGRLGAYVGAAFENLIIHTNITYEAMGLGCVTKNNTPMKVIARRPVYSSKSTVDFCGYLADVGFVAFDAKTTEENYWQPDRDQLHQFLYLLRGQRQMDRTLARFFYLVERRTKSEKLWYLVEDLEELKRQGRYTFYEQDLLAPGLGVLFDYRKRLQESIAYSLDKPRS